MKSKNLLRVLQAVEDLYDPFIHSGLCMVAEENLSVEDQKIFLEYLRETTLNNQLYHFYLWTPVDQAITDRTGYYLWHPKDHRARSAWLSESIDGLAEGGV